MKSVRDGQNSFLVSRNLNFSGPNFRRQGPCKKKSARLIATNKIQLVEQKSSVNTVRDVSSSSTGSELSPEDKETLRNMVSEVGDHISSNEKN